jgi:hypothetical protein
VKIDLKINGLVACGSNPVRTFAGLTWNCIIMAGYSQLFSIKNKNK